MRNLGSRIGLFIASVLLGACGAMPQHNNTVIFSVKRDIGLGLATPSATDPGTSITLGYRERQLAWVPVWANGANGPLPCDPSSKKTVTTDLATGEPVKGQTQTTVTDASGFEQVNCNKGPKLLGDGDTSKGNKNSGQRSSDSHDALSTFASFGGDLGANASADRNGGEVRGRIASFFATGIAAQYLAKQTGLVSNVFANGSVKPGDGEDPSEDQLAQITKFIAIAEDQNAKSDKVLEACVVALAKRAEVSNQVATELKSISRVSAKDWVAQFHKRRGTFENELPFLSRAAGRMTDQFKTETGTEGRDKVRTKLCSVT